MLVLVLVLVLVPVRAVQGQALETAQVSALALAQGWGLAKGLAKERERGWLLPTAHRHRNQPQQYHSRRCSSDAESHVALGCS